MGGYFEAYRAFVVSADDPMNEYRLQVEVPEVSTETVWAAAERSGVTLPAVGDEVWVRYEGGSPDHPIWSNEPGASSAAGPGSANGALLGTYRGVALDPNDPGGYGRVLVQVPEVSIDSTWAMPEIAGAALPAVGDEIWVRYEGGSPDHPTWSGGSGTGGTAGANPPTGTDASHGIVVDNSDPGGFGRVAVEVPALWPGHTFWAMPAHDGLPAPAIGAAVLISYEGGSPDHPVWSPG
jgi:hypothetical protein